MGQFASCISQRACCHLGFAPGRFGSNGVRIHQRSAAAHCHLGRAAVSHTHSLSYCHTSSD